MPRNPVIRFKPKNSQDLFEVDEVYVYDKPLGSGAYGVVCAARNKKNGAKVAIKKVSKAFDDVIDAKRTLREIKLLRHLNHPNVVPLVDLQPPESLAKMLDVYEFSERMDTDLNSIIRSPQALSEEHIQYFVYQLLCGLKYLHSAHVIHRDLKPGNLLVNRNCDLKICDFGLARVATFDKNDPFMTEYVVTRWYRAPELILTREYDEAIDMWSVGCILGELLERKPIFRGTDYIHQVEKICETIGAPQDEDMTHITHKKARDHVKKHCSKFPKVPWEKRMPAASAQALHMVENLLQFNPAKRLTAKGALEHPFMSEYHEPEEETTCDQKFNFEFEHRDDLSANDWKELVMQEILHFHPEAAFK